MRIGAAASDGFQDRLLHLADTAFVALVEGPLLDALGSDQSRLRQDLQVLAGGRLADAQLVGDKPPAYPILHQVAIDLARKMGDRVLEPFEDLKPTFASECPHCL